jgi:lysine 6-dehydrogenase
MKVLVIGCGFQAFGASLDLVRFAKPAELILADAFPAAAEKLQKFLASTAQYTTTRVVQVDASDVNAVAKLAEGCALILNGVPYKYVLDVTRAAIQAKVPAVDFGGDTEVVMKQLELSDQAAAAGITIVPDCGMGPGMTNITVGHAMELLDTADSIITTDGGIPTEPQAPLFYHLVFAIETLTNEYTGMTTQMRGGKLVDIAPLAEIYPLEDFPVVGRVEATHGMGMLSTLPWTYQGRVDTLENRFVRYPGHLTFIKTLVETGFFSREKLKTEHGDFEPRAMTKAVLEKFLMPKGGEKDVSIIQTISKGTKDGKKLQIEHLIVDHSDASTGLTSMQRTTGFTGSMVGQMIVDGRVKQKGVVVPELAVPKLDFFEEAKRRGFEVTWSQKPI